MPDDLLGTVKAALARITPGPWKSVPFGYTAITTMDGVYVAVASKANRAGIVATMNAAPALIARCEQAEAEAARLREAVRRAVNATCSCGGRGPDDEGVCAACLVWHRAALEEQP